MIEKRGDKFCVMTEDGRVLGEHPTRAEAEKQLAAVEASKARRAKENDHMNAMMRGKMS